MAAKLLTSTLHSRRCEGSDLLQALPIDVELEAGPVSCQVSAEPGSNGCYACTYIAETAGSFRLLVTSRGKPIGGSPLPVEVSGAAIALAQA